MAAPKREQDRNDNAEPIDTQSSTDNENTDPKRAMPISATEDPNRENDRREIAAPNVKKSSTDIEDARRANDRIAKAEPMRA